VTLLSQAAVRSAIALACLLGLGCGGSLQPTASQESTPVPVPTIDELPFPSDDAPVPEPSYEPRFGEPVEREALYVVAPVAGGKNLQAVSLRFDDGEVWVRSYRPVAAELQYADKRVVVTGRPYTNSPYVQSVAGTHFELHTITLAPGETARDPVPQRIPAPPFVENRVSLEARVGLWAHCVGRLESLDSLDDDNPWWGEGTLALSDGSTLVMDAIPFGDDPPRVQVGDTVTALGLVLAPEQAGAMPGLGGPVRFCTGRVERCSMDDGWQRDFGRK